MCYNSRTTKGVFHDINVEPKIQQLTAKKQKKRYTIQETSKSAQLKCEMLSQTRYPKMLL